MLRFGLSLAAAVFVLDQGVKYLVLSHFNFGPPDCAYCGVHPVLPFFQFAMVWNTGVSFGMLKANADVARWALVLLSFVISGIFFWWLRTATRRLTAISLGLVIGGALGNVVDRIRFGAVADFLDFHPIFPWVFNVADASISVGAAFLLLDFLKHGEGKTAPGAAKTPPA